MSDEKDPKDPSTIGDDLADLMRRATPTFGPCDACGEQTSGSRCFDCEQKSDRIRAAREATLESIPETYRWATMASPLLLERTGGNQSLIARAQSAVGATHVLLMGHSGSGKTSLAVAMLRAWSDHHGRAGVFALASDLATARSRSRYGAEAPEVLAALSAPLLVLDDLGTDKDVQTSAVTEVIFHRDAHAKPTWITTWTSHEERVARYGDGLARRVIKGARIIDCGGGK